MVKIEVSPDKSPEHSSAEQELVHEKFEKLSKQLETNQEKLRKNSEKDQSHRKQEAEKTVAELAKSKLEQENTDTAENKPPELPRSKADKEYGFKATMHSVRKDMSVPEKQFSKFIHRPVIEKTSEIAGKTVARPSAIAGAAIAAFIGLMGIYGIAKFAGFTLSGSEMPLLLALGFAIGLIAEWTFKAFRSIILGGSNK